ncbi:MAG: outer membrane protein assembly factor BamD [Bacteroidetes bacterium]|nr:outer membrane protein assembly factor BamD [Bacteroidota bacterium]
MALVIGAALLCGCGSSEVTTNIPVEERFRTAKALFDDEDYLPAINEFTVITLQHQGSAYADSAQFLLAECRYHRGEYLLAATEYGYLKRIFPSSPLVPEAQYKLAMSYYNLSPKPMLDQQYTKKAIDEFQEFIDYYPSNEHAADAANKIMELNTRLAKKAYDTARLYGTMEYYKASIFYYDDIIEKYHDTEFAPLAYLGKVEVLITRKKYEEARTTLQKFYERFPNSVLKSRADKLKETVDKELQEINQVSDSPSDPVGAPGDLTQRRSTR